jgi:hypothetical protein
MPICRVWFWHLCRQYQVQECFWYVVCIGTSGIHTDLVCRYVCRCSGSWVSYLRMKTCGVVFVVMHP